MGSLPVITTINSVLYLVYIYTQTALISPQAVAVLVNGLMLFRIVMGFGLRYSLYRISRGQIFPTLLYIIWLAVFPRQEHLYLFPILLSNIGKCYLLFTPPNVLDIDAVQSLIILQAKFEIAIITYVLLRLLTLLLTSSNAFYGLVIYSFLLLIMKVKYEIHYGTRRAYEEIHFGLDRMAKAFNLRGAYHLGHRIVSQLGGPWNSSKQITY